MTDRPADWEEPHRLEKLSQLRAMGIEPYQDAYPVTLSLREAKRTFEARLGEVHTLAGRLRALRLHGRAAFADLDDGTEKLQLHLREDLLGDRAWATVALLDIGDIIGVKGPFFRTRRGEDTLEAHELTVLTKALRPLPAKWHGLQDVDLRYRQRYLDLIANPEVRRVFEARSRIVREIRRFLDDRNFMEMETPVLSQVASGAAARPFVTHSNALDVDAYLRIATELHLKRLLVGGFPKVYELGRVFRNEGIDRQHNPEFTMLEVYEAYVDEEAMMCLVEELLGHLVEAETGGSTLTYQGVELDFATPWPRVSVAEVLREKAHLHIEDLDDGKAWREAAKSLGLPSDPQLPDAKIVEGFFEHYIEAELVQPTFLVDYPVLISPLAKRHRDRPAVTRRFEPYVFRLEIGNGFAELTDPLDQRERFVEQARQRNAGDEEAHAFDEDFLKALEHGMPPAGGLGVGVDRLVALFTDQPSLRDVILFPFTRPKEGMP